MKFRKIKQAVLAGALGAAMGIACAQQVGVGSGVSAAPTPAQAKTAVDLRGNQALTSETAVAGTPIEGSPGTQSGPALTETAVMGASRAPDVMVSSRSVAGLDRTQLRALQRYEALR